MVRRHFKFKSHSERKKVGYELLLLMQNFMEIDQKTRYYGTDVPIHYAEIHVLQTIAENPGIHVGGLAELMNITKGSVSEILKKLEKKGLIVKNTSEQNLSRLSLTVTEKGEKADLFHKEYHDVYDKAIEEELKNISDDRVLFILNFLSNLNSRTNEIEEKIIKL